MNWNLLWIAAPALLIGLLAVAAGRRGRRGHVNPPSDYHGGNPWIQSARETATADNNTAGY